MATPVLDLTGGKLDLAVVAGRDGAFLIPTLTDMSSYQWSGQVRSNTGQLVGAFVITLTSSQAAVLLPAAVTAVLPLRAEYEIEVTAPGSGPVTLLSGTVIRKSGVVA